MIAAITWDVKPNIRPMELYLSGHSPSSHSLSTRKELCCKWEEYTLSNFMLYHALGPLRLLVLETHSASLNILVARVETGAIPSTTFLCLHLS